MHLVPTERAHRKAIDEHTVCLAIEGIGEPDQLPDWADRFALLGEPHRLAVLLAVHRAGPIAVTDLATATGIADTAVSQILRLLRAGGTVTGAKDGRIVRYELKDAQLAAILDQIRPASDGAHHELHGSAI
ncbi:ArsR/SmtB family transcription factor [Streptacidiphilus fuscans]|uniref:Helix-turn-helix transcriptional regulator n=1 Tax=Streptacidiphilus fuscans TaxID=2789292 RepID=A0A931B075_9ACTN|nr:metalloregulator ArsR/SmtB family transcription factor [Streptacidiphilus fuscans]MBF9066526.1 helix-turn-helix transcriptional regulator [Streptacidiphilus fuscans]